MKILRLHIQNLNSLRDRHTLDFTVKPFKGTGLFAITGDTGAGKTTILDAMTLALYGKTPRKHEDEIMTYGTKSCMSELEFEVKGKAYRAKWSRTISNRNNLQKPRYEIVGLPDEKPLVRSIKTLVLPTIVELTGLNYEQFLRSVLLAQGEFAAFLKATKDQRSELLEKITGTEEYTKISIAAYDKFRVEKDILDRLKQEIDQNLLTHEEETNLQTQLEVLAAQHQDISTQINQQNQYIKWLEDLENAKRQKLKLKLHLEETEAQLNEIAPDLATLETHKKVVVFEQDIIRQRRMIIDLERLKKKVRHSKDVLDTLHEELIIIKGQLQEAKTAYDAVLQKKETKEALFEQVIELDLNIENHKRNSQEKEQTLQSLKADIKKLETNKTQLEQEIQENQSSIIKIEKWLNEHQEDENIEQELPTILVLNNETQTTKKQLKKTLENIQQLEKDKDKTAKKLAQLEKQTESHTAKIEVLHDLFLNMLPQSSSGDFQDDINDVYEDIEEIRKETKQFEELLEVAKNLENYQIRRKEVQEKLDFSQREIADLKAFLEEKNAERQDAESRERDKQRIYEQERLIKNYEAERQRLIQGEKCPLCFSLEHPCHDHDYVPQVSITKKEWNAAKKVLKRQEQEFAVFQARLENEDANWGRLQNQKAELTQIIQQQEQTINAFSANVLHLYQNNGRRIPPIQRKMNSNFDLLYSFEEAHRGLIKIKSQWDKLILEQKDKNTQIATSKEQFQSHIKQLETLNLHAKQLQKDLEEHQEALANALRVFGFTLTDDFVRKLEKRKANFQRGKRELEKKQKNLAIAEGKILPLTEQIHKDYHQLGEDSKALQSLSKTLSNINNQRQELFGDKNPKTQRTRFRKELKDKQINFETLKERENATEKSLVSKEQKQEAQVEQFDNLNTEWQTLTQHLEQNAQLLGFSNQQAMEQAILSKNKAERIEQNHQRLTTLQTQRKQSLSDTIALLAQLEQQQLTEEPLDVLQTQVHTLNTSLQECAVEMGGIKQKLAYNSNLKTKNAAKQIEINDQKLIFDKWAKLKDLIGSADGKKFRIYAQSLTLRKLVAIANNHLKQLNDRYFIKKSENVGEELKLSIIDRYQGDSIRSMSTLSGGESFIVSLALALGLSDLAGRNAQIKSLFIDEGFGTLDAKNLDIVLQTLDNLQATGKTIGVISHVQELKERIYTQVRVEKKGGGFSQFEIFPS